MPPTRPALVLPPRLHRRAIDVARAALPNEACGLLVGDRPTDWSAPALSVVDLVPVANSLASPVAFTLDPGGMLEAETRLDDDGRCSIGVFHSHPTSQARPSARDTADAAEYDPDHVFVQLLASIQGFAPGVRAWRYGGTPGECVELSIVDSAGV